MAHRLKIPSRVRCVCLRRWLVGLVCHHSRALRPGVRRLHPSSPQPGRLHVRQSGGRQSLSLCAGSSIS